MRSSSLPGHMVHGWRMMRMRSSSFVWAYCEWLENDENEKLFICLAYDGEKMSGEADLFKHL